MRPAVGALVLVAAMLAADEPSEATREAERRIAGWNPSSEDRYVPPSCIRVTLSDLRGLWIAGNQWVSSELRFSPAGGRFDVAFGTRMNFVDYPQGWTLRRTAQQENGAIVLDRAVEDSSGVYRRLWPLLVGPDRAVALVPSAGLEKVRRAFAAGGCSDFSAAFECDACFVRSMTPRASSDAEQSSDDIIVNAEVISPSVVEWRITVWANGSVTGMITEGQAERRFSAKTLPPPELNRIRALARCVGSVPEVYLGVCTEVAALRWPPSARLKVRVGDSTRESGGCIESLTTDVGSAGQPNLELLLAMQRLLPASRAFDLRPSVSPVLKRLMPPSACGPTDAVN